MNPTFLDSMSWEMAEVYGAITDQILINLARYFPYIKAGNVPRSAFTYQAAMLAQMGQVNRDTIRIIKNNLKGADRALSKVLEQSIIDAVSKTEPKLLKAVKAGILKPAGIPIVAPNQMRAFNLYYQQAAQKLNLVNTVMLESTQQAYQATVSDVVSRIQATQTALDIGTGETITGVSSWNQALRHSINRMKENGITGFIDHGNHHWSAEAYVAMDIRTTVYNTGRAAVWETNQNFGNDLYIVSYHDGARPLCYPWQNKVISSTNHARVTYDLDDNEIQVIAQSDTSYGQPAGLFGINCKHYPSPFIPGVSALYDKDNIPSEKENEKIYQQTQEQRALERKLREEKRDLLMAKAQGADPAEIKALRARCRETSDDIDKFCEETGLPRRQNREGVFTQRDFPAADTYDPKDFERKQKDEIDEYFKKGGAQQGYTFGEMTPVQQTISIGGDIQNNAPEVQEVNTNIEQFRSAAVGAENKVDFWMNLTPEQQSAFIAQGLDIDEVFDMVKDTAPREVSEWATPNPGGAESFAIKHDFSSHGVEIHEVQAKSEGWMADANESGVIHIRSDGLGDEWDFIMSHEAAHQLANASPELQQTILLNPGGIFGRFNTRVMAFDGIYGEYNPEEAFATAVSVFVRHPEAIAEKYPEAYMAIENLFNTSPSARDYIEKVRKTYIERFLK